MFAAIIQSVYLANCATTT